MNEQRVIGLKMRPKISRAMKRDKHSDHPPSTIIGGKRPLEHDPQQQLPQPHLHNLEETTSQALKAVVEVEPDEPQPSATVPHFQERTTPNTTPSPPQRNTGSTPSTPSPRIQLQKLIEYSITNNRTIFGNVPVTPKTRATLRWRLLTAARAKDVPTLRRLVELCQRVGYPSQQQASEPVSFRDFPESDPPIPPFIQELDTVSTAVFTRLTLNGESKFYVNEDFSSWFFSSERAQEIFDGDSGAEPLTEILESRDDVAKYLGCMCDLMLAKPDFEAEGQIVVRCRFHDGSSKLCLFQIRTFSDETGNVNSCSCRIVKIPSSEYEHEIEPRAKRPRTVSSP